MPLLLVSIGLVFGAQWTIGVYMCADNGMNDQAYCDLAEMMAIGSTSEVNIVVQIDNAARDSCPGCRRYFIDKDRRVLLSDLGEVDMADTSVLADFAGFLGRRFPAKRFGLILWDHGNGWSEGLGPARTIFIDESHGHVMGVAGGELRAALRSACERIGQRFTFLGFDACAMGQIEVAMEVRPFCDYILASEGLVPWGGFPYDDFLALLVARPNATPTEFLPEMCNAYVAAYPGEDVCLSALDMRQLERVVAVARATLADSCEPSAPGFRHARQQVQTFSLELGPPGPRDQQVDLIHYWQLAPRDGTGALRQVLNPLVVASRTSGRYYANALGVSTWFPWSYLPFKELAPSYQKLVFAESVPWLQFLNSYYGQDDVKPSMPGIKSHRLGRRGDVRLFWGKSRDLAPVSYRLYEGSGVAEAFTDRADNLDCWSAIGWTTSSRQAHSPPSAFFSGSASNLDNQLILVQPVRLERGGLLSCFVYYATEESEDTTGLISRDVCYIEWSPDRVNWSALDSLYGSAQFWQECRFVLPPCPNLYLRFRYLTNAGQNGLGLFLDDIRVQSFEGFRLVAQTADTSAYIFNLARETTGYCYFLAARDSFGNCSYASQLYPVVITAWAEPYTLPAPFSGPCSLRIDFPAEERPDVLVYTLSGALVRRFPDVTERTFYWDGRNQAGRDLADGIYIVLVQGKRFRKLGKIAKVSR
ncbi:MAG: clostripain-related cysteine peptidase [candidate division WOR-3 bacterium]